MSKKSKKRPSNRKEPMVEKKLRMAMSTYNEMLIILDHPSKPYHSDNEFMKQAVIQKIKRELKKYE